MKRYVSIDFLRGFAIFMMIFFHLLTNLYDMSWVDTRVNDAPIIAILMLILGLYMGSWAGLFLMISAMGNMISMQNNFEKGVPVIAVIKKQVVGGLILLVFAFLAEGIFQYYGVFVSYYQGTPDPFRAVWHAYTMETIHTIATCTIINGIIQGLLSLNNGYLKVKRNILIYLILTIIVFILTQPLWDFAKSIYPTYPVDQRPSIDSPFSEYLIKFFLLFIAGSPEPIFPFLGVSFIGTILGILLTQKNPSDKFPAIGMLSGLVVFLLGAILGIIFDVGFSGFLPLDNFSNFVYIGGGLEYKWITWILFITGGQIIFICLFLRLVEFRGKSAKFAQKTKMIRRFGVVAFSMYCFHRIIAIIPIEIINYFWHKDPYIYCQCYNGWFSILIVGICLLFTHFILVLWEKVQYIGGLEWMMGVIGSYLLKSKKSTEGKQQKWYQRGAINVKDTFYDAEWINIVAEEQIDRSKTPDSRLAMIMCFLGLLFFPFSFIGLDLTISSFKSEGKNKYNSIAKIMSIVDIVIFVSCIILLYLTTLSALGVSL